VTVSYHQTKVNVAFTSFHMNVI